MDTIALAVPVVVGLELAAAFGLAWLCWRLAARRDLLALRDIARAFVALGVGAVLQLFDGGDGGDGVREIASREFGLSFSIWLYLGFMILGAAQLASNNFVTEKVRRNAVLGAIVSAVLSSGISLFAVGDPVLQDTIANALRAGGTGVACLIIARAVSRAPAPPKMLLGASVVRVALSLVTILAAVRGSVAMFQSYSRFTRAVQWQPLLTVEFLAHCALGVGLLIWILDRDWALADASIESAEHRAASDALTGLPNRTIVLDRLDMAVASAQRSGTLVGVLFIDLDDFKAVNDRHGHAAGDAVLCAVGFRLQQLLRASDTVGRFGGDEFVAISPFLRSTADLDVVVQKVRDALQTAVPHEGMSIPVDGSVGAALFPRDADASAALLAAADADLYRDKGTRRLLSRQRAEGNVQSA
jgi:diguanylate cyclase (GGDEF)-like protein